MTIIDKTDNKLTIPVGIGVVQTETTRNFYNTSDATATANDILVNKTAYGKYGKLTGTLDLDAEKEISYQDGYETGKTDGYDSGYDIGYGNGYTEGETNGYNNGYNTGVADGVVEGKNEIIEGQSDATITPQNVLRGYVGYGKNNERIVGESDAVTSIDVGASGIKFGNSTFTEIPSYYDFSNVTDVNSMFDSCRNLTSAPLFDTSNISDMGSFFGGCRNLTSIPQYNTSNATNVFNMLGDCWNLTTVPEFDLSGMDGKILNCTRIFASSNYVINFGGFKDLGKAYQNSNNSYRDVLLQSQSKLSYESCKNVINKVYDLTLKPDYTNTPKIRFHATPYALLSPDDIAIATSKGWIVQAG